MNTVLQDAARVGLLLFVSFFGFTAFAHAQDGAGASEAADVQSVQAGGDVDADAVDEEYALVRIQAPAETHPPEGWALMLGQSFGDLGRVQLGTALWLDERWAVGLDIGFDYVKREFTVGETENTELVQRVESVVTPQLSGMYTLATAGSKRLLVAAAVGPYFSKPEGESTEVGVAGHIGPGIDWPLSPQLSLHFQQRVAVVSDPNPEEGIQVGLQPYFAAVWWF